MILHLKFQPYQAARTVISKTWLKIIHECCYGKFMAVSKKIVVFPPKWMVKIMKKKTLFFNG